MVSKQYNQRSNLWNNEHIETTMKSITFNEFIIPDLPILLSPIHPNHYIYVCVSKNKLSDSDQKKKKLIRRWSKPLKSETRLIQKMRHPAMHRILIRLTWSEALKSEINLARLWRLEIRRFLTEDRFRERGREEGSVARITARLTLHFGLGLLCLRFWTFNFH